MTSVYWAVLKNSNMLSTSHHFDHRFLSNVSWTSLVIFPWAPFGYFLKEWLETSHTSSPWYPCQCVLIGFWEMFSVLTKYANWWRQQHFCNEEPCKVRHQWQHLTHQVITTCIVTHMVWNKFLNRQMEHAKAKSKRRAGKSNNQSIRKKKKIWFLFGLVSWWWRNVKRV